MSAPAPSSSSAESDAGEYFVLPSSIPSDWAFVTAALSTPIADEAALILTIRRCEHYSRTEGRECMPADPVVAPPAPGDSPRPFAHPPFPSLFYFLRDHFGRGAQSISDAEPNTSADAVAAAVKAAFFDRTLPALQRIALRMPELFPSGRLHRLRACASPTGASSSRSYTRLQLLCLVSHLFFCTLRRGRVSYWSSYACWFSWWKSEAVIAYLHTAMEYFSRRVEEEAAADAQAEDQWMQQRVTFTRAVLSDEQSALLDSLSSSATPLSRLELSHHIPVSAASSYPAGSATVEIDFAHPSVSFGRGGTQEELMLGMSPETHIAPLILEDLLSHESATITAAQRIGTYEGYGCDVKYSGRWTLQHEETSKGQATASSSSSADASATADSPLPSSTCRSITASRTIVALDASNLWSALGPLSDADYDSPHTALRLLQLQYEPATLRRDLCKALVGLSATRAASADDGESEQAGSAGASSPSGPSPPSPASACAPCAGSVCVSGRVLWSGSWGCGSFGGDLYAKLLIQWIAASLSGVSLVRYQTFADESAFETEARELSTAVQQSPRATVAMLWAALLSQVQRVRAMDPASLSARRPLDVDAIGKQLFDSIRQQL